MTTAIIQQFKYSEEEIDYSSEPVDAKVITLESDHIIFLDTGKNYKIVDPATSRNKKVLTKTVWQMELDDYLLIFNENQSSIISNIADKFIFSDKALQYRSIQQKWKNRLQKRIDKYGIEKTSKILQKKGVESARPQNLKNWLKETTIIPKDSYNVLVALGYTDDNAEKIIKVCNRILAGHIKAGNMIRRKAEDKIMNSDLRPLLIRGSQKFEIPDLLGATFVVDRIVGIDKVNIKVPQSRIMQMYELNSFTF